LVIIGHVLRLIQCSHVCSS